MKKNCNTIVQYKSAIEFIEYFSIFLESGQNIPDAFFLSLKHISKTDFCTQCLHVLKNYRLGLSFYESLQYQMKISNSNIASEFFENICTSMTLGTQLTEIIRKMSDQFASEMNSALEARAHKAPIKMIFPLVIFIFPVLFTLIGAKTFINFVQSLGV